MQHAVILAIFALEMFNAVLAISPQLEDSELEANDGVSRWRGVTQQETLDCRESIVHERQAAEKLEEEIPLARRETDLALANKQKEVDQLRRTVITPYS